MGTVVSIQKKVRQRAPGAQIISAASPNQWRRNRFEGITADTLSSVIKEAERGELERWADLAAYMLRTDGHLKSVYESRLLAIPSAEIEITAGRARPGEEAVSERAAEYCRRLIDDTREWEDLVTHLGHGEGIGYAGAQHVWKREFGLDGVAEWRSYPKRVDMRDVEFADDWTMRFRTWTGSGASEWLNAKDYPPFTFLSHVPAKLDKPTVSGDLMAIAWLWLFKRWALIFQNTGMERLANGLIYGEVPKQATPTLRAQLLSDLENLSANQVAVFEEGTKVSILEASKAPGEVWSMAIKNLNDEITKAILGSTDAVDAEAGSYARAEVQVSATVMPRLQAIAKRIATTIERDWLKHALRQNAHLFGGVTPPCPTLRFVLEAEEPPEITPLMVEAGAVSKDELRASGGLEAWGPEKGGDQIAKPVAKSPLEGAPTEGAAQSSPFRRRPMSRPEQMSLPLTTRRPTSRTSGGSRTRIAGVPFERSGDRER